MLNSLGKISDRDELVAAYSFRYKDLHYQAEKAFREKRDLIPSPFLLNPIEKHPYRIFIDLSTLVIDFAPRDPVHFREIVINPVNGFVTAYVLTSAEWKHGARPADGLQIKFYLSSNNRPIIYTIGVNEGSYERIDIKEDDLRHPKEPKSGELPQKLKMVTDKSFWLGAKLSAGELRVSAAEGDEKLVDWIRLQYPNVDADLRAQIFSEIILVRNVATDVVSSVTLSRPIESFPILRDLHEKDSTELIIGSKDAKLNAPKCPTKYSEAYIDQNHLREVQDSVSVTQDSASFDKLHVSCRSLGGFAPTDRIPQMSETYFSLWLSRQILSDAFDFRLGENIGVLLGAHYADRCGPIKWWLAAAWVLENIGGSLTVTVDPEHAAQLTVRFEGRTKFDGLGYVDAECFSYELGSFDAFHENFDFSLVSRVCISNGKKVVFVGGFDDVFFSKWQCIIRTAIDQYLAKDWESLVAMVIAKYVIGEFLRMIVEGGITSAMGSISMEILDATQLPVIGKRMEQISARGYLCGRSFQTPNGIDILIGCADNIPPEDQISS